MSIKTNEIIDDADHILITRDRIQEKVKELAEIISADYRDKVPVMVCVLNGSFMFFADLVRELRIDCEVDFIKISSYGDAMKSSGTVTIKKNVDCHLEGRDVIIVEDIIESGLSVQFLREHLQKMNPKSIRFVSLLIKQGTAEVDYECEYYGFTIPNRFVIGYGLDYAQKLRNLPAVYLMPNSE